MPFNWNDPTQPPFNNDVMTLTHDECIKVKDALKVVKEAYEPSYDYPEISQTYIINTYNRANLYEPINGSTYSQLEMYDPEYNTQGIDHNGIVPEPVVEPDPEPTPEEGEGEETAPEPTPEPEQQPETEEEEIQGA
jgi:hypothetical protein